MTARVPALVRCEVCTERVTVEDVYLAHDIWVRVAGLPGDAFRAEDWRLTTCTTPVHKGACFTAHWSEHGASPERRKEIGRLRARARAQRESWHGSAGEKGPGL